MKYRNLGRTGYEISEIGYGAWGVGGKQWLGGNDDESLTAMRRALELGVNFIDTALAYGDGHSEKLVGQVVREAGRKIYVATKVPPKDRTWPARPDTPIGDVFPQRYIVECAEESLRNLCVDTIDLLQLHVWTADWTARDEWRNAFANLQKAGKVQKVGISVSEHDPDSALEVIGTGLIDAVQVIYNVFDQTAEARLFPLCQKENIGVLARVPLDEGALSGTINESTEFPKGDFREWYFRGDRKKQVAEHVEALRKDLGNNGEPLPELALRFCLSNPAVSSVIPGMRKPKHVESNTVLPDKGPLPRATIEVLKRNAWDRNFYK